MGPLSHDARSALAALALLSFARIAFAGDAIAPFERGGLSPLPPDTCQELRIERVGEGVLEVRFFTEPLLRPTGPDSKTSGAALLFDAADVARPSLVVYDPSGAYARSTRIEAPVRWSRTGSELCIASGSAAAACASISGEILGSVRVPFGPGWETAITGCAGLAARERPLAAWIAAAVGFAAFAAVCLAVLRRRRDRIAIAVLGGCFSVAGIAAMDPWRLPSVTLLPVAALVSLFVAGVALVERHRLPSQRTAMGVLALCVVLAVARVPHPVWVREPAAPAVPQLWLDPAHWHPRAAHQSLEFRERPLAAIVPGAETWLVLGGSVVFGDGVQAEQAFPAVAQDRLRADGDPIVLLNAGAQGWNIGNIDRLVADLTDGLPITGIVLVSILNNATLPIAASPAERCDESLLRGWLCVATRNQLIFPWPKAFLPKPSNLERYRGTLSALLERERGLGRKVVLLDEVADFDRGGLRFWDTDAFRAVARDVAAEFGASFHDVDRAVASLPPNERFLDGIHPTPALHVLLGERLAEILRER